MAVKGGECGAMEGGEWGCGGRTWFLVWEIVRRVPNSSKTTGERVLAMYALRWCRPIVTVSGAADFAWVRA